MLNTLEESCCAWEAQGMHGTAEERLERAARWDAYYAYLAQNRKAAPPEPSMAAREAAEHLAQAGVLHRDASVLDLGAGMGDYTLTLAAKCGSVTALDRSRECLDILQSRAAHFGLTNITSVCQPWERYEADRMYDVTFSSMCPAICNLQELQRMEAMTRQTCCLIAVMRGSYDKHRRAMMQQFQIQPKGGMTTEALQYFETLYLLGRQPNVICRSAHASYQVPVEQAMEQYQIYFEVFGMDRDTSEPLLRSYFAEHATDGYLEEESQLNTALIYWTPHR